MYEIQSQHKLSYEEHKIKSKHNIITLHEGTVWKAQGKYM